MITVPGGCPANSRLSMTWSSVREACGVEGAGTGAGAGAAVTTGGGAGASAGGGRGGAGEGLAPMCATICAWLLPVGRISTCKQYGELCSLTA